MTMYNKAGSVLAIATFAVVAACSPSDPDGYLTDPSNLSDPIGPQEGESGFFDLFTNVDDPNTTLEVNRYIWNASLEILNFLPIESVDPFSGVIVTGYGVPPGGGRSYRATIYIQDPALDARSLNISLQTKSGPASVDATRAIEDAILTRARQMRIADSKL